MGEGKRVQKKEISDKTAVKAVITGYISYGVLVSFLVFMIIFAVGWAINKTPGVDHRMLSVVLSLMGSIIIYFTIHGVCNLSIYDVFKKCKMKNEYLNKVHMRLNLFVILVVAFSAIFVVTVLTATFNEQKKAIFIADYQYKQIHSEEFATSLTDKMLADFEAQKANILISTIIYELGVSISLFSLIPYQRKILELYNEGIE